MIAKHRSLSVEARQMMRAQRLQLIRDRYRKVVLEPRAEIEMEMAVDADFDMEPDFQADFVFDQ